MKDPSSSMRIPSDLYHRLSSIRLTIFLCILLAVVALLGTLIPQNLPLPQYEKLYGRRAAGVIATLEVSDLYHSPGFVLLLCLLAANLVACTWRRLPTAWRALKRGSEVSAQDKNFKGWKHRETFVLSAGPEEVEKELEGVVARALQKRPDRVYADSQKSVFRIERFPYARLGPYVAHGGILIILLGGLLGALFGFRGSLTVPEGGESSVVWLEKGGRKVELAFRIRCNRFVVDYYPSGSPREYRSEVSLLDHEGRAISEAAIRVNHPFTHKGLTFYQSTFGSIPKLTFRVENQQSGETSEVETGLNEPFLLPGKQGHRAMAVAFQENLVVPAEMVRMTSFPRERLGPAARIVLIDEAGFQEPFWVLQGFPEWNHNGNGLYHVALKQYSSIPYTGLQVARDPGTPVVWIGCLLLVVGFILAFLLDHEILWVTAERRGDGKVVVRLAGKTVRHPTLYADRFEKHRAELRQQLSSWLESP